MYITHDSLDIIEKFEKYHHISLLVQVYKLVSLTFVAVLTSGRAASRASSSLYHLHDLSLDKVSGNTADKEADFSMLQIRFIFFLQRLMNSTIVATFLFSSKSIILPR